MSLADGLNKASRKDALGKLADILDAQGVDLDNVRRVVTGFHQGYIKNADGEIEYTKPLPNFKFVVPDPDPEWPIVQPARPVRIAKATAKKVKVGYETTLLVPDPQIGGIIVGDLSKPDTLELFPMHDEAALTVAVQVARDLQPDRIVILGDWLDLADWSTKFARSASFERAGQYTLDQAHLWLAQFRAACPIAEIDFLEGNHEKRIPSYVEQNAKAAFGLRQAGACPESWPVLSVPYLLNTDALGITYHAGYPQAEVWLRDDIRVIHGKRLSAKNHASSENDLVSTFFGHTHRMETQTRTYRGDRGEPKFTVAVTCGTLSRLDGAVPSFSSGTDPDGRPVKGTEDWQQGLVVATYGPEVGSIPTVELVPITGGTSLFRGKHYTTAAAAA